MEPIPSSALFWFVAIELFLVLIEAWWKLKELSFNLALKNELNLSSTPKKFVVEFFLAPIEARLQKKWPRSNSTPKPLFCSYNLIPPLKKTKSSFSLASKVELN
jgi:hypothetical protein